MALLEPKKDTPVKVEEKGKGLQVRIRVVLPTSKARYVETVHTYISMSYKYRRKRDSKAQTEQWA